MGGAFYAGTIALFENQPEVTAACAMYAAYVTVRHLLM